MRYGSTSVRRLLAAAALVVWWAGPLRACSKTPYFPTHWATSAHFVATPTADTVFAGPGEVKFRQTQGHMGPEVDGSFHGQVVSLHRVGGPAAAELQGSARAVLVPWDYGPDCTPTPWSRSARWLDEGVEGLYMAGLRPRAHWVDGMPTFDLHAPQFQPFPSRFGHYGAASEAGVLSLEEMYGLLEVLPVASVAGALAAEDLEPLLAWARANPEASRRFPAAPVLSYNLGQVESARIRAIQSPLAGTYRLRVTLPGGEVVRAFLRTQRNASSGWRRAPRSGDGAPFTAPRHEGYYLLSMVAARLEGLPSTAYGSVMHGYLSATEEPVRTADGGRRWEGTFEMNLLGRGLPGDTRIQRADSLRHVLPWSERSPSEANTLFTETRDGSVRFVAELPLAGGTTVRIEGERISVEVVSNPSGLP